MTPLGNQRFHVSGEKRQQQRPNVRAVGVGVGHDSDLAVPKLGDIELVVADPAAKGADDDLDLIIVEDLVQAGLLDVEDFAPKRQYRLHG